VLASQASRVYLREVSIYTATDVVSHVYSISLLFRVMAMAWVGFLVSI